MIVKKLIGVTLLVLLVAMCVAQEPGPPGRGGPPPFRFGPPGFERMIGGANGFSSSGVSLLSIPTVRKELNISELQQKQIDDLNTRAQQRFGDLMQDFDPREIFGLAEDEREKRFESLRTNSEKIGREADVELEKILSPDQWSRLKQLRWQRQGASALLSTEVSNLLELSEAQSAKLKEFDAELRSPANGPFGGPGGPPGPPDFGRMEQRDREIQQKMLAELSDTQKAKWTTLQGKAFEFPPSPRPGFGGPGGMMRGERKLLSQFDKDGNKRLDQTERQAARESLKKEGASGRAGFGPPGPFGGPGGAFGRGRREPAKPGPHVEVDDVAKFPDGKLYDPTILRTLFLKFENDDWETELSDFHQSDVDVPATLIVDGVTYPNVGVHFRGMSSYGMVPAGFKRSLNLALDLADPEQRLYGYKTLNLLNAHEDASCMSTVLYSQIARKYIPAPQANFVKVVINGEYWGVYVNVQQFNKEFLAENFKSTKGNRWKVRGSPGGGGGLDYVGDKIEDYRRRYEIKSKDSDKAWRGLIKLCQTLSETPTDQLPAAIEPMLDVDQLLWFLALDVALINNDGYWVRASDYSIYQDEDGKFHIIPHDMNEAFHPAMMMGFGARPGGPARRPEGQGAPGAGERRRPAGPPEAGGTGLQLDPLIGLNDARKPLRSKILAVPDYQKRYLEHVRTIATESLNWDTLGPSVARFRALIEVELKADTKKLETFEAFERATSDTSADTAARERTMALRDFAGRRREFLLKAATGQQPPR